MADRPTDSALSSMIQGMSAPQAGGPPPRGPSIPTALAVPAVLLVAAIASWLVYRYATKGVTGPVADVVVLDDAALNVPGRAGSVSRQRGAIHVRGMDYQLRATRGGDNNAYRVSFDFTNDARQSWVTPEQWDLHQLAQRATSVPKFARHIKLTDEQRKQLQALSVDVQLSDAELQKLRGLVGDWDRATDGAVRRSAEGPLLDAGQVIAAAHRADARAAQLLRVEGLAKIITPEQRKLAETYILPTGAAAGRSAP